MISWSIVILRIKCIKSCEELQKNYIYGIYQLLTWLYFTMTVDK